ncbi:MAG: methylamine utilization protein, partial [Burkholderiales bacterium]|nr:methylamine utilization protein [Burkholderiales bacterium]
MLARLASFVVLSLTASCAQAAGVDVLLTDAAGKPLADAVVMLEPVGARLPVKPMQGAQIVQHHLQFDPPVTVVTTGTAVMFPNQDTVKHHVYSYSAAR